MERRREKRRSWERSWGVGVEGLKELQIFGTGEKETHDAALSGFGFDKKEKEEKKKGAKSD
eukprot:233885-Hanusia_phi.AAC.1